jgi:hypothetical protein
MTHSIVARQECDISVGHLYKWALRVVNRPGDVELCRVYQKERRTTIVPLGSWWTHHHMCLFIPWWRVPRGYMALG